MHVRRVTARGWCVSTREKKLRCVWRVIGGTATLIGAWGRVWSPMAARLPRVCRSAQDDLSGTLKNVIGAILAATMQKSSGLCSVKLLNDGSCRSGTQGRRLDDIGGSTARGCGGSCDGGSVVKKKTTLMKTRLLRKGQSSGSDTMLEIQNDCIVFLELKNIHQCLYIGGICVRYK